MAPRRQSRRTFCLTMEDEPSREQLIERARMALRSGDAAGAHVHLDRLAVDDADDPVVRECLGRAAYLELDFAVAIEHWQRSYAGFRAANDQYSAVRVARSLAPVYGMVLGDGAVMSGWMARAQTLLGDRVDSPEAGWVALNLGMFEGDRERKDECFRRALAIARSVNDTDLEIVTLAYLGASLVHGDQIDEGMRLLDEALAAVAGAEVESFQTLEEVFCQLFSACEHAHDVARADQWIRVGEQIAAERRLPSVAAFCQTHYGGVLTVAGRWDEADAALTEAVRLWGLGWTSLRPGALARLGELRVRQGRFEDAARLLDELDVNGDTACALPRSTLYAGRPHWLATFSIACSCSKSRGAPQPFRSSPRSSMSSSSTMQWMPPPSRSTSSRRLRSARRVVTPPPRLRLRAAACVRHATRAMS